MATFAISTCAGRVLAELPLEDTALDLVVGDLFERLPPPGPGGAPRLLLGPRELGSSERLGDLALAPGNVLTLVILPDPEKAAAALMGTEGADVRLLAARVLGAMGVAAAGQAGELADAVLSDPDAEVVGEALQALRAVGEAADVTRLRRMAQLAQDLEDPCELGLQLPVSIVSLKRRLLALLQRCDESPGQAALRRQAVLRRLAPLDPGAARRHGEPLPADPLNDRRVEVRLAAVAALASALMAECAARHLEDTAGKLQRVLQTDACLDVRRRAAAALGGASRQGLELRSVSLAHAALAAEVQALAAAAPPAGRCRSVWSWWRRGCGAAGPRVQHRLEDVQSLQELLA